MNNEVTLKEFFNEKFRNVNANIDELKTEFRLYKESQENKRTSYAGAVIASLTALIASFIALLHK